MSREKRLTVVLLLNLVLVTGLVLAGLNQAGGVVAGALPPLYGMAGKIVTDVTPGLGSGGAGARAAGLGYAAFALHDAVGEAKAAKSDPGSLPEGFDPQAGADWENAANLRAPAAAAAAAADAG